MVQSGPTSVTVSWTTPSPPGHTTGYTIFYSTEDRIDMRDISGDGVSEKPLTGLQEGAEYSIYLVAISPHLPSKAVIFTLDLVLGIIILLTHPICVLILSISQFPVI